MPMRVMAGIGEAMLNVEISPEDLGPSLCNVTGWSIQTSFVTAVYQREASSFE